MIFITTIITEKSNKTNNLKAAVAYSKKLNWPVFPLWAKGKNPIHDGGFHNATTDIPQIIKWWRRNPIANIGIPTGKASGFIAVDIDPRNNGHISLENLIDKYGKLPDTVEALTGGGGRHILFKYKEGIKKGELLEGIDIQGDGAYIAVSPSVHPNGKVYEWELSSRPLEVPIAEPPIWLINMLKQKPQAKFKARPTSDYLSILQGVTDGERNNSMMSLIGHLLAKKIDYKVAYELVRLWNERNDPPLPDEVVTRAFNNILRREAEKR